MKMIKTGAEWFDWLLPDGLAIPSSTLLTGPGGSGKPLIGNAIVAAWLRQGGSVIFMSLQYPDHSFIIAGLERVAGLDLNAYMDHAAFIELDATLDGMTESRGNHFKANLVKPTVWDAAIDRAAGMVPDEGPGILVFSSALNLLLFSPTYWAGILEKIKESAEDPGRFTYLFSASTTAKAEEIAEIEAVVDNLVMTHSLKKPFRLYMQVKRAKDVRYLTDEVEVPIAADTLMGVKEIADHSRKRVIPLIQRL